MQKSFKQRLAELEALEGMADDQLPPVASLPDDEVLAEVLYALHSGAMYCWHDRHEGRYWACEIGLNDVAYELWLRDMKPRIQPLIDQHADAIARLIPPNNGDERRTTAAVMSVLGQVYAEKF